MANLIRRPYIGLALGGGGARGLAHIGVLKALERANVPIDFLSGSSMGGLIAGLYAAGLKISQIETHAVHLSKISNMIKLIDLSPPRRGLLKTDRIKSFLENILEGDRQIQELPRPLNLTAVDLITRRLVTKSQGSLVKAILATCAVPGLFSPIKDEKQVLVDGGVLNNVPADTVRKMGAEYIIAVDVNYLLDDDIQWAELSKVSPLNKILPSFAIEFYQAEIIMVSALTEYNLKGAGPSIVIRPQIPAEINVFFGFTHAEKTIAIGEEATDREIPKILAQIKSRVRMPHSIPGVDLKYWLS